MDQYIRLVRACYTVARFMYGDQVYRHVGSGGVLTIYDHIWFDKQKFPGSRC